MKCTGAESHLLCRDRYRVTPSAPYHTPSSDPIQPFSSPSHALIDRSGQGKHAFAGMRDSPVQNFSQVAYVPTSRLSGPPQVELVMQPTSDEEDEMPSIRDVLREVEHKRTSESAQLLEVKRRALAEQNAIDLLGDDDSDLEIVASNSSPERRLKFDSHAHAGKNRHRAHPGGVRSAGSSIDHLHARKPNTQTLERASASAFGQQVKPSKLKDDGLKQEDLQKLLLMKAQNQAGELTRAKEEEWRRRGGQIRNTSLVDHSANEAAKERMSDIVAKGLEHATRPSEQDAGDDEDRDSDDDYQPEDQDEEEADSENGTRLSDDGNAFDSPAPQMDEHHDQSADDEEAPIIHKKVRSRKSIVVPSDDEDDSVSTFFAPSLRTPVISSMQRTSWNHRESSSSLDDRTEGETDKENDEQLKYDRGENKENSVILSNSQSNLSIGGPPHPLDHLEHTSPSNRIPPWTLSDAQRSPLKEIAGGDDGPSSLSRTPSQRFNERLKAMSYGNVFSDAAPLELPLDHTPALDLADSAEVEPAGIHILSLQNMGDLSSWADSQFMTAPQVVKKLLNQYFVC